MDRLKNILFIILFAAFGLQAQNLDSLYNEFIKYKKDVSADGSLRPLKAGNHKSIPEYKCGFGITSRIKTNFNKFSIPQQNVLAKLLGRPETDTSLISPKGLFRIHFTSDTNSYNYPGFDIDSLAEALDYVYDYEINFLGYKAPPDDMGEGGDNLYDVYVQNTVDYGYTEFERSLGDNRYTSFMVINNDYKYFKTKGLNAAKVTAAHEFHHAIQLGRYIYREEDLFFYEMTSTAMEEFVFDQINDYYYYMNSYFSFPYKTLSDTRGGGYDIALWHIFLVERYGHNIIKRMWELMPTTRAVKAIGLAIDEEGSTIKSELNEFGVWTYFTNNREIEGEYFEEAKNYPLIKPLMTINFSPPSDETTINQANPLSNNFLQFTDYTTGVQDTLMIILTNGDLISAIDGEGKTLDVTYILSESFEEGSESIFERYYAKVQSSEASFFMVSSIFNNRVQGEPAREEVSFVYPQPFSYSNNTNIHIPVIENGGEPVLLNIYSVSMDLVFSGEFPPARLSNTILWNGLNANGEKLATGIYVYAAKSDNEIKIGKLVIYNE